MKKRSVSDVFSSLTRASEPFLYNGKPLDFYNGKKAPRGETTSYVLIETAVATKGKKRKLRRKLRLKFLKKTKPQPARQTVKYHEYIISESWRKRCRTFYKRYGRVCAACGSYDRIVVHHMSYVHMGNELDSELAPLCWDCHGEYHRRNGTQTDMIKRSVAFIEEKRQARQLYAS